MRRSLSILAVFALALGGCGVEVPPEAPPQDRFYFPTGVHFLPEPEGPGTLFVASSNFDRRYDFGAITAVDLGEVGLPAELGTDALDPVETLPIPDEARVLVAAFAGVVDATVADAEGNLRLFVPTRSEGDNLFAIDWDGTALTCVGGEAAQRDCTDFGISLTDDGLDGTREGFTDGKPRAPAPYAATVVGDDVWVTHVAAADSPIGTLKNRESYVVRTSAANPSVDAGNFLSIGQAPSSAVAVGQRYTYIAGRQTSGVFQPLRLMDRTDTARVLQIPVLDEFRFLDVRDIVLSPDETRAYLLARAPDVLLVLSVDDATGDAPQLRVVRSVALPEGPTLARVISRQDRGALVAITCTVGNALAVYDDDSGQLATIVTRGMVVQPFGLAVHLPPVAAGEVAGARLFVSGFGDGRVAVVDIPDVSQPSGVFVRLLLGTDQRCLTQVPRPASCPAEES